MSVDLQEFLSAYLVEADEHLAAANAALLAIEPNVRRGEAQPRAVRDVFRALHTIKGLSAMVGVEPIVAIAHRMETVLRVADRAGGRLATGVFEVLLQGLRAIEQRLRMLGSGDPVPAPPVALLEALDALEAPLAADDEVNGGHVELDPDLERKVTSAERAQLVAGAAEGRRVVRIDFVPSPTSAAAGLNINVVRERVAAVAEIVKVIPIAVPVSEQAPGGLSFVLLTLSTASTDAMVTATGLAPSAIVELPTQVAPPMSIPPLDEEPELISTGELRRNVLRVDVKRVDDAMERLAAVIVTRSRLMRSVAELTAAGVKTTSLQQILLEHARQVRDLRAAILRVRMVPVSEMLERAPLIVRGLQRSSGKQLRLVMDVGATELDKSVADRIFPALMHLVRNAIDHGIESAEDRVRAGKPEEATLRITAVDHSSTRLEITVVDDGRGVDRAALARRLGTDIAPSAEALLDAMCKPGISTLDQATTTSGRGMGMDIVRRITVEQLGGELTMRTEPNVGTTFTLRVPLTVSIVDCFTLECANQRFVVPVAMVEELVEIDPARVVYGPTPVTGGERRGVGMLQRRGEAVPLIELATVLKLERTKERARKALVVRRGVDPIAFGLERVLGQQEAVIRPLEDPLLRVAGIAGATDLGDGRPTLVLDLVALAAGLANLGSERAA